MYDSALVHVCCFACIFSLRAMTEREIFLCYGTPIILSHLIPPLLVVANMDSTDFMKVPAFVQVLGTESDLICLHLGN